MIPRLGDGNSVFSLTLPLGSSGCLENDSPSRGRKRALHYHAISSDTESLENDSPSRGRKPLES